MRFTSTHAPPMAIPASFVASDRWNHCSTIALTVGAGLHQGTAAALLA